MYITSESPNHGSKSLRREQNRDSQTRVFIQNYLEGFLKYRLLLDLALRVSNLVNKSWDSGMRPEICISNNCQDTTDSEICLGEPLK